MIHDSNISISQARERARFETDISKSIVAIIEIVASKMMLRKSKKKNNFATGIEIHVTIHFT